MIDRKMRKNEKEGVMQRENERIIYHLMHFNEKDKEWSERPYLLLEDMAIVFDILDLDGDWNYITSGNFRLYGCRCRAD